MHHKFQFTPATDIHLSLVVLLALVCITKKKKNLTKTTQIAPWFGTKVLECTNTISKLRFQRHNIFCHLITWKLFELTKALFYSVI